MRESKVEKECKAWAKDNDWLSYKFVSPGQSGVPDQIFLKDGITVFVEFKAPGKKASPIQNRHAEKLRAWGFKVYVIDNLDSFITAFAR